MTGAPTAPRSVGIRALLLSTHPGPAIAVTLVAVGLASGVGLDTWRIVVLGVAVALNQASVGWSNDWIDADRDRAVGRSDKPVAAGLVTRGAVRTAAIVAAVLAVAVTLPLGWAATLVHAIFIASAWSYNAGLKSTPASVVPYIVSFGLLPLLVTLSLAEPRAAAWWAMGLGALLGTAAHFANVLPDLDDDRATGVRGLPHRLGAKASGILTFAVLEGAGILGYLGAGSQDAPALANLVVTSVIAAVGVVLVLTRPPSRLLFRLIIAAALLDVFVLATAGTSLLA